MTLDPIVCDNCGKSAVPKRGQQRFCSEECRRVWHREHDPRGTVRSVRRLKDGGVAVIVHFRDHEADRAISYVVGQPAVVGAL